MATSIEIMCPRSEQSLEQVFSILRGCNQLGMTAFSLTHSSRDQNAVHAARFAAFLRKKLPLKLTQHLSAAALDPQIWNQHLQQLRRSGVRSILCLSGDQPNTKPRYKAQLGSLDLIKAVKSQGLEAWASGYPIAHVRSPSAQADLDWTFRKIDAGAKHLVTQFCFDTDVMMRWAEKIRAHSPETQIIWGMLPIRSQRQIEKLHALNGLEVPMALQSFLDQNLDDQGQLELGTQLKTLERQCLRLYAAGETNFHVYSFNQPEACLHLLKNPTLNPGLKYVRTNEPLAA